jgi:hypothetical protein
MRNRIPECSCARGGAPVRRFASGIGTGRLSALLMVTALAGCASPSSSPFTVFADPGKYEYYSCEQIDAQRKTWSTREQELRALMSKAERDTGGVVVNMLAYRADHVAASEELRVLEAAARSKNCDASTGGNQTKR